MKTKTIGQCKDCKFYDTAQGMGTEYLDGCINKKIGEAFPDISEKFNFKNWGCWFWRKKK